MGFRQADSEGRGGFARVWSFENKGKYSTARLSTSKKTQDDEGNDVWATDFQDGFRRSRRRWWLKTRRKEVIRKKVNIKGKDQKGSAG